MARPRRVHNRWASEPQINRVLAKVDRSAGLDACWPWTGGTEASGYGRTWFEGRQDRPHRVVLAHHLGRPLAPGMFACHRCDNPPCCNPAHLFEGTHTDNMLDAKRKGRMSRPGPVYGPRVCPNGHIDPPWRPGEGCVLCRRASDRRRYQRRMGAAA